MAVQSLIIVLVIHQLTQRHYCSLSLPSSIGLPKVSTIGFQSNPPSLYYPEPADPKRKLIAQSRVFSVVVHKLMQTHFQSFHRTFGKRNVNFLYQRHESPILCSKNQKKGHKQIRRADVCSTAENGPDNLTQSQIRTIQTILEHYLTK